MTQPYYQDDWVSLYHPCTENRRREQPVKDALHPPFPFATTRAEKAEAAIERLTADLGRCREQHGYAVDRAQQHQARAEAAEQAAQRVRGLAGELRAKHYLAPTATADAILRALDGGAS